MSHPSPYPALVLVEPPPAEVPADGVFVFPVSFNQQGLWLVDQFDADQAYSLPVLWRVAGGLDPALVEKALNEIVRRHEILRTTFSSRNGELVQVIFPEARLVLPFVDLSSLPESESEARALNQASEETRRPFDLSRGALFRAHLWRIGRLDHLLLLNMHHIVSDGWSVAVLTRELSALYDAFAHSRPSPLPDLALQYADFAEWQRQRSQETSFQEHARFWKTALAGAPSVLELRTDRPRPGRQTYAGASEAELFPSELTVGVKELSRREGATPFMTLLAAFFVILHRHTDQTDLVVGSPIANRTRLEIEPLIGLFINTLVLRADLSGDPTFRELLARVQRVCLDAYAHQDLPFEKLVEALNPGRTLSHTPLFQVMMTLQNVSPVPVRLGGAPVTPVPAAVETSKFDLTAYFEDRGDRIWASFEYNTALFEPSTVRWMLAQLRTLLEGIVSDPDRRLSRLPILTDADRQMTTTAVAGVRPSNLYRVFPPEEIEQSITDRFEQQARRCAGRLAVKSAAHQWTYERLAAEAGRVARALAGLAGAPPRRIALLFEQDAPMIAAILGALQAGETYVPLDPTYPVERLNYMLRDSDAAVILTDDRNHSLARSLGDGKCKVANVDRLSRWTRGPLPVNRVAPDTTAYILYTSGSTGRPKGVVQNHRNVLHFIRAYTNQLHIHEGDRLSLLASYSFDAAVMDIFGALLNGATLCLWNVKVRGVTGLAAWVKDEGITVFHAVPTVFREFAASVSEGQRMTTVRLVVLGGEEVRRGDVESYRRHFTGDCLLVNGLGPTESTIALQYFLDHRTEIPRSSVPVGYAVDDTEILLLDAEGRATELRGEIGIRSRHLALGYWANAEATQAAFLPDPEGGSRRIYRTGDLGYRLPDGAIEFLGRKGSRVKIRGHRIELAEIEETLTQHPSVGKAAVVLREGSPGDERLIAYLVRSPNADSTGLDLRTFLEGQLPDFMLPSSYVWLDAFPLTTTGKVDRGALPAPGLERSNAGRGSVGPRTGLESRLVAIWEKTLQVRPVGIHDNFFDLGGHSLLAVRLLAQVEKTAGRSLPLSAIFQAQTVAEMAARLEDRKAPVAGSSLLAIQPVGSRPPLFCVHALGSNALEYRSFTDQLGPDQPIYGLVPQGLDGRLPPHERVEDMAACYIKEIRGIQPEGPYYLGGWSFGGVIAFEMARQLQAADQRIAFLTLFDTYSMPWKRPPSSRNSPLAANLAFAWRRLRFHTAAVWRLESRGRRRYLLRKASAALRWARRNLSKPFEAAYAAVRHPLPETVRETHAANRRAAAAYVPKSYPGEVILFRATGLGVTSFDDPYLGWAEVPGIDIEVIDVPGEHVSLLREQSNVRVLAEKLAARLRLAQTPEGRRAAPGLSTTDRSV